MTEPVDPREAGAFFLNVPQKLDNPFPDFQYFRERRPVFYYPPVNQWFIFKYDDVSSLFADDRLSADRMRGFIDAAPEEVREELRRIDVYFRKWMLMKDGEDHVRIRRFMQLGFNPGVIHNLLGPIQQATDELLDSAARAGRIDVAADFAFLLPAYVLSDFFGVHREDREKVVQWSVDFVDFFNIIPINADTSRRLLSSGFALIDYTKALIAERRANPRDDFLGTLVDASSGGDFTEDEIVANTMLILLAGHVAVRNLIGNAVYLLLTHPDQLARFKAEPALVHPVIEETLRFEPPVTLIPRIALEDIDLRGSRIRQGQIVQLSIASANRDEERFPDPERFVISRKGARILSFGNGPHACLGAGLAMEEARVALETLFRRIPELRLDESREIRWYRNAANRGPINLPLVYQP